MSSQRTSKLFWPDVMFLAEAEHEAFANVQIITLYSHCLNTAEGMLFAPLIGESDPAALRKKLEPRVKDLLPEIEGQEFVEILEDRVVICIDADTIDDDAVARGLDLLTHIDNFQVGSRQSFGNPRSFSYRGLH